jgi:hypothetical protein
MLVLSIVLCIAFTYKKCDFKLNHTKRDFILMLLMVLLVLESRIKKYNFKLNYIIESLKIFFFQKL